MFKRNYFLILIFILTLALPVYGSAFDEGLSLNGVSESTDAVELNAADVQDGSFQQYLNDCWENGFPGRKLLLKVRNQLLYSLLDQSPNSNVIVGKEGCLFEPIYILYETQVYPPETEDYFDKLSLELKSLKELLNKNGKELYIFLTPSKAHYMKDKIPDMLMYADKEQSYTYTNREKFIEALDESGVDYYDSVKFIDEHIDDGTLKAPLFYNSGIHWSHPWGRTCAANFLAMMKEKSRYDLSLVSVSEEVSDEPIDPDTDLYSSMNLLFDAKETWYDAPVSISYQGKDKPSVFIRGGSFLGQSMSSLVRADVFGSDVHFENNYWFHDKYSEKRTLSGFTAYDELPLDYLVGKSDIVILEVNEAAIANMSFGFMNYISEHPEYTDTEYTDPEYTAEK